MPGIKPLLFFVNLSAIGLLLSPLAAVADDNGTYVGGDVGTRFVYTEGTYGIDRARLKGGYRVNSHIAVEAQVMSGGSDTDYDAPVGYRKWEAGTSYGLFVRPMHAFHRGRVELYGLFGISSMESSYHLLDLGVTDTDNIRSGVVGVGGQYNFTPQLGVSLELTYTNGFARYAHVPESGGSGLSVSVFTAGASAGMNYRF